VFTSAPWAPREAGIRIDAVSFQCHGCIARCCMELGSLAGPADKGAVVDFVVKRKYIGMIFHPEGQPAHRYAAQEVPYSWALRTSASGVDGLFVTLPRIRWEGGPTGHIDPLRRCLTDRSGVHCPDRAVRRSRP
jgi:hypothetical protein